MKKERKYSRDMYICSPFNEMLNGCVAQLDRAPDYGSGGLGFESLRVRQKNRFALRIGFFIALDSEPLAQEKRFQLRTILLLALGFQPAAFAKS